MSNRNSIRLPRLTEAVARCDEYEFIAGTDTARIYRVAPGILLKLFDLNDEYAANLILRRAPSSPHLADVYRLRIVNFEADEGIYFAYAALIEELAPLGERAAGVQAFFDLMHELYSWQWIEALRPERAGATRQRLKIGAADAAMLTMARDCMHIFDAARRVGIEITDFHSGNLGLKNNVPAMFDVR